MAERMSPTSTLITLISTGMLPFYFIIPLVIGIIGSVLFAVMSEGRRPTIIFICRMAASNELFSLCVVLFGLTSQTLTLAATGISATILCICMIAIIISLTFLGILLAFVLAEYDQTLQLWIEILIMQRRLIRARRELNEQRRQLLQQLLLKLFPTVTYTSQGIGSKFRDCAICLNDFVEGEHCWVLPLCKHIFHTSCVDPWLRTNLSCPMCRNSVLPR